MYAGCIVCCPLVSHIEYALHAVLTLEKQTGQTDRCQTDALLLMLDADSVIICNCYHL